MLLRRQLAACKLLILLTITLLVSATYSQEPALYAIDDYVKRIQKDWETPGFAISIVKDDKLIFAKGYGVREIGKNIKVDEHTLFAVASNTKAFTAALLGILVEEGKLDWSDPVIQHLPQFAMYDPYVSHEITIRDLLIHNSGLSVFGGDHLWIGGTLSRGEIIQRLRYMEPNAPFRAKYQYNNLMYLTAGEVYPAVTGVSWDDAIHQKILTPLGMTVSNTSVSDLAGIENVATPHEKKNGQIVAVPYDNLEQVAPAAALNTNVLEMANWMRLNLNNGMFDGTEILSENTIKEMQSIHIPRPISHFNESVVGVKFSGYGLGWGIINYKGRKIVTHSGGMSGMISLQTLVPEESLGIMVVTNFAPNSMPWALTYFMLDQFLDPDNSKNKDWSKIYLNRLAQIHSHSEEREKNIQEKRVKKTKPSLNLEQYTGVYYDDFSGKAIVRLEDKKLVFDYNPRHLGDLEHWHYDTFRVTWRDPIFDMPQKSFLTFYLDDDGSVEKLKVRFYDPLFFKKLNIAE